MYPEFSVIAGITLHSYGLMIAIGVVMGQLLVMREAQRQGLDPKMMGNFVILTLFGSFLGARLLFVLTNLEYFTANFNEGLVHGFGEVFAIWNGGVVYYGGFIAGLFIVFLLGRFYEKKFSGIGPDERNGIDFGAKNQKLGYMRLADIFIPSLALGHVFGRLGCFFAACCYGAPSDLPWAISFPAHTLAAELGVIHPSQLYSAMGNLLIFIYLIKLRPKKKFHGQLFLTYLILYPVHRSLVESFRGDVERGFVLDGLLSTSQFISIFVALLGLVLTYIFLKRSDNHKHR